MNDFSINKIKELNAVKLTETKEYRSLKVKGREVYWTWTQEVHIIRHLCPMTRRIWFMVIYQCVVKVKEKQYINLFGNIKTKH